MENFLKKFPNLDTNTIQLIKEHNLKDVDIAEAICLLCEKFQVPSTSLRGLISQLELREREKSERAPVSS